MMKKIALGLMLVALIVAGAVAGETDFAVTAPSGWEKNDGAALAHFLKGTGSLIVTADTMPADVKAFFASFKFK